MSDYSREALLEFLDYASEKGLMNSNTASSRKVSSGALLSILDPAEALDLRTLDLDDLMRRFSNINSKKYSPGSLRVYLSRLKTSLEDFIRYQNNPAGFRLTGPVKQDKKQPTPKRTTSAQLQPSEKPKNQEVEAPMPSASIGRRSTINVPIPLHGSCFVTIHGLPIDLTEQEAARIANVIKALASN